MAVLARWLNGKKYLPGEPLPSGRDKQSGFATPQISGDYEMYDCPVTGKPIEGRAAHRENLKRTGSRILEPGESREAPKRREENIKANLDKILQD